MFEEISKSLKATLYDRISNPLLGAFGLSWAALNWKIVYTLFFLGSDDLSTRFSVIKDENLGICKGLIMPALSAVLIVGVLPFISRYLFEVNLWHRKKDIALKWKYESEEPISKKEAAELRIKIRDLDNIFAETVREKEDELRKLQSQIDMQGELPKIEEDLIETGVQKASETLRTENLVNDFLDFANNITNREVTWRNVGSVSTNATAYNALSLIERFRSQGMGADFVQLTPLGKKVFIHLKNLQAKNVSTE